MGTLRTWEGKARALNPQVATIVVGSSTNGHVFNIYLENPAGTSGEAVLIATDTASGDTTSTIATALHAQLAASKHEFARALSYSVDTATITVTANVAGVPFIVTTTGSTGTLTYTVTTANEGPNDWSVPSNWKEGIVPVDDDDILISNRPDGTWSDILYGLNQDGITADTVTIHNYKGRIGARATPLWLEPTDDITMDSGEFYIELRNGVTLTRLLCEGGKLYLTGETGLGSTITGAYHRGGTTYYASDRAHGFTVTTLRVDGGDVFVMPGMTHTNLFLSVGTATVDSSNGWTLIQVDGGSLFGTMFHSTTVTQNGGYVQWDNAGGTITTYAANGGTLETRLSRNLAASKRTITTLTQDQAATVYYDTLSVDVGTHTRNGPFMYRGAGNLAGAITPNGGK